VDLGVGFGLGLGLGLGLELARGSKSRLSFFLITSGLTFFGALVRSYLVSGHDSSQPHHTRPGAGDDPPGDNPPPSLRCCCLQRASGSRIYAESGSTLSASQTEQSQLKGRPQATPPTSPGAGGQGGQEGAIDTVPAYGEASEAVKQ
jgi:hypothetical protein